MSMTVAVVVMVVVILIIGGAGYAALNAVSSNGKKTVATCSPPTSPVCQTQSGLNDVILNIPYGAGFGQAVATLQQGLSLPATVSVSGGESVSSYAIFWGDGSNYTGTSPTTNHIYTSIGDFVISAQALVGSTWHSGPDSLFPIVVQPNYQTTSSGFYPSITTTFSNGSSATTQFGWLVGQGSVSVSATYTSNSTAAGYTDQAPTLASTGGTQSALMNTPTSVSASYAFTAAGLYYITMVGAITAPTGTIYQNYTWTVYVSPTGVPAGCSSCSTSSVHGTSPHQGQIIWQEVAPGGATSEDPSVAYDTLSYEPILNVYQTLVTYNGSSTASFMPQLSMCVPGPGCAAMYSGNTLIVNNVTTPTSPQYFTFPIDKNARFFDPSTGNSWAVYPSDVAFSMSRTCGFANLPGFGSQPGWIQCQSLLPYGNSAWDGGIHDVFNNTPQQVLGAMLINDSTYCPSAVMANSNGCVTFNAYGGGAAWPFFLQLVADPLGGSVEPCGWFTAQSAGVPGFVGTTAASGDGPCFLPGGASSTSDASFTNWMATTPFTAWDAFEQLALNTPGIQPNVRLNMVGSGPYYLANQPFHQSVGYTLEQNPAYEAPAGCVGQVNCEPLPGPSHYVAKVTVNYQATDTLGMAQYQAGQTDFASILPGETLKMLSLMQEGKIGAIASPTLNINLLAFDLKFDPTVARTIDPDPITVPGDFFSYIGLREFLVNAFPYNTVENTLFTTDSVPYGFNSGGVIPQYMGNYYPANVSWPSGDPVSNPSVNGSAAWWWTEATTSGSPYYDPELASCTASSPCQFPIIDLNWGLYFPDFHEMAVDYLGYITSLSGGRVAPTTFSCSFSCYQCEFWGCSWPFPMYNLGWVPDYPDPTDYVAPFYYPNATYTSGDEVQQALSQFTCSYASLEGPAQPASFAGLMYWANAGGVPQVCQGNAYGAMVWGMNLAAGMVDTSARVLIYNLVEHIANELALYVYFDQQNTITTYASWIDPTTINTNPMVGGAGDNTWYLYSGNGVLS